MAILSYNEIVAKTVIEYNNEPYEVLSSHVFRMQQRKPVNQTKLRNLKTGSTTEQTFHVSDKVEEAEVETRPAVYIYNRSSRTGNNEWWFHETDDKSKRFSIDDEQIGNARQFLTENTEVTMLWFEGQPIQVRIPIKMELKVREAPPNVRGNTAQGGNKVVTLETGATLNVPMFIEAGNIVRVNTETGEYVERV